MTRAHYRTLSSWLKQIFGEPVRKISIDVGLGCPNRVSSSGCIYCNPRGSGTGAHANGFTISEQAARGIEFLSHRYGCQKFIAYFQSYTNTYGPPELLEPLYREALADPRVVGLSIGTRPDCVPDAVLDMIAGIRKEKLVWIEYGLQSAHARTLTCINRGHDPEAFFDAVHRTRSRDIPVVAHLILGLPGESVQDMVSTAQAVSSAGVHGVKLHPLYVIRGTELENMMQKGLYAPLTEEDAIDMTLSVLQALSPEIVVHRLTSDPHRDELVGPLWMLDKRGVRARLEQALRSRDIHQGATWDGIHQ